ncbi:MAG: hypothetical protein Q8Q87_04015, partial [Candidatus Omnitrophota bacterium]|nr:hypothetical protein [Candidatus Omnitrophota bacterium]
MIVISMPAKVGEAKRLIGGEAQWCYLGKDLVKRESVSKVLGEENRFYLKKRLQKKSEELGDSYIGFVCGLSKRQKDGLNWWASKFASKRFMQTDFYLHVCYKAMAQDLIKAEANHNGLVIVVEDSWLFNDMKCTLNDGNEIEFLGNPSIALIKIFSIFRGLIHRIVLVVWIVAARLLVRYHHGGLRPKILETAKP